MDAYMRALPTVCLLQFFSHMSVLHTLCAFFLQMLAAAINATCLALVDAGIPLKYLLYLLITRARRFPLERSCAFNSLHPPARNAGPGSLQ